MVKSKQTSEVSKPSWLKVSEEDLKKIIAQLAEKYPPSQIGLILRDQYGIPKTRVYGKKLGEYLKEIGIERSENLENAEKKLKRIEEHFKKNITDKKAKHKLQKAQGQVNILRKYTEKRKSRK